MKTILKVEFYVFGLLCLIPGGLLLLAPGRFLGAIGWAPIDPLLSRLLGSALLGMVWMVWRGTQRKDRHLIFSLVELFFIFTLLGSVGLLRHLLIANWPFKVWALFAVLAIFSLIWVSAWLSLKKDLRSMPD